MTPSATPSLHTPAQEPSMAERAYDNLRQALILLDIAPGEAINEVALTAELGLGRTPIREALKRLESDHLVVSYPRRGTFAAAVDLKDLAMISEVREVLEPLAARKAARNCTGDLRREYTEMIAAIQVFDAPETPDASRASLEFDLRVHRLVYRTVNNHHLSDPLMRLDDLATRIWCVVRDRIPDISDHVHEHIELLQAILDGDENRAAACAAAHVHHFENTVRGVL